MASGIARGIESATASVASGLEKRSESNKKQATASRNVQTLDKIITSLSGIVDENTQAKLAPLVEPLRVSVASGDLDATQALSTLSNFIDLQAKQERRPLEEQELKQRVAKSGLELQEMLAPVSESRKVQEAIAVDTGKEAVKLKAEGLKKANSAESVGKKIGLMFDQSFELRKELESKYPEINRPDMAGRASRIFLDVQNKILQNEPKLQAYQTQLRATAVKLARDVEGGRVTNQDMENMLLTLQNPVGAPAEADLWKIVYQIDGYLADGAPGTALIPIKERAMQMINELSSKSSPKLFEVAGKKYNIPPDRIEAFMAKNPGAKELKNAR